MKPQSPPSPSPADELVDIRTVRLDPSNVATHDEGNSAMLRASLDRRSQYKPVIVDAGTHDPEKRGIVRAGNELYRQMLGMGFTAIWVNWKEFDSETSARAFAVADNMAGRRHGWNSERRQQQLESFADAGLTGLDCGIPAFEELVSGTWLPPEVDADMLPPISPQWRTYEVPIELAIFVDAAVERFSKEKPTRPSLEESLLAICQQWAALTGVES